MTNNVPIQSLIDHIKTAIDVDPWAKEMAEGLLKEQESQLARIASWLAQYALPPTVSPLRPEGDIVKAWKAVLEDVLAGRR